MSELKYFLGKTASLWVGEYNSDGESVVLVVEVEKEMKKWLICRLMDEKNSIWINKKKIFYIQEGDAFDDKENVKLLINKKEVKKE